MNCIENELILYEISQEGATRSFLHRVQICDIRSMVSLNSEPYIIKEKDPEINLTEKRDN